MDVPGAAVGLPPPSHHPCCVLLPIEQLPGGAPVSGVSSTPFVLRQLLLSAPKPPGGVTGVPRRHLLSDVTWDVSGEEALALIS